jgi:hypothetical protein
VAIAAVLADHAPLLGGRGGQRRFAALLRASREENDGSGQGGVLDGVSHHVWSDYLKRPGFIGPSI